MTGELRSIRPLAKESLRGIEPAAKLGKSPKIEFVDPRALFVEDKYQRSLSGENSTALIRKIISGFDWSRFKAPICVRLAEFGNVLVVIDGQHSATAAASHPLISKIPVMVVDAAGITNRARAFVGHNRDRINLTQGAIYRAELAAGDPLAQIMERACKAAGAEIITRNVSLKDALPAGQTIAVATIRNLARNAGEELLTRVLSILTRAGRGPIRADEIAGLAIALNCTDAGRDDDFRRVISDHSAERWHARAQAMAADTALAIPVALATLWREELGLSRPDRNAKPARKTTRDISTKTQSTAPPNRAAVTLDPAPATVQRPAPSTRPAPVETKPAPAIVRGGISLDVKARMLSRGKAAINLDEAETAALAMLLRVMPAILTVDHLASKAFGSAQAGTLVRPLFDALGPRLARLKLKLREVPKMGFALGEM